MADGIIAGENESDAGSQLLINANREFVKSEGRTTNLRRVFAYVILATFTPLMLVCTWNAVGNLVENNS